MHLLHLNRSVRKQLKTDKCFFFFPFFRSYWQPQVQQKLVSSHWKGNPFEFFAIKEAEITLRMIVGLLPMENSRVTKFILGRRAGVYAILMSTNYFKSPLVQEGMEMPCHIEIHMFSTVNNKELVRTMKPLLILFTRNVKNPIQFHSAPIFPKWRLQKKRGEEWKNSSVNYNSVFIHHPNIWQNCTQPRS